VDPRPALKEEEAPLLEPARAWATAAWMEGWREDTTEEVREETEDEEGEEKELLVAPVAPENGLDAEEKEFRERVEVEGEEKEEEEPRLKRDKA